MYKTDTNLVYALNDHLVVQRLLPHDIETMYRVPINDSILNILRVPTDVFQEKAGKQPNKQDKKPLDYLFVLLFLL